MSTVLMSSGAETERVEETVCRVGEALKIKVESNATPTGITVAVGTKRPVTRLTRVKYRTIDHSKLTEVNNISRRLVAREISLSTATELVKELLRKPPLYSPTTIYIAQALCCAGFAIILGGGISELAPAFLVGLLARWSDVKCCKLPPFLSVFINAFVVTSFAAVCHAIMPSMDVKATIIAGIVPLLPGLTLCNAISDLMAGQLIAGMARTTDSILVAAALAAGAAVGMSMGTLLL